MTVVMRFKYQQLERTMDEYDGVESKAARKVVVVGDGGCGKTCLLSVFATGVFPEEYFPTIFETSVVDVDINGRNVPLELWDTAGQEDYDRLRPLFYPNSNSIIVCFSLVNRDSLGNVIERWMPEVRYFCPATPVVLVGTKADQRRDASTVDSRDEAGMMAVTSAEGRAVAEQIGARTYVECSARTGERVSDVFCAAALAALKKHSTTTDCAIL